MTTRIVLADDHPILRQGLRSQLEKEPGFSVVGEAADGLQVASLVEQAPQDILVLCSCRGAEGSTSSAK